MRSVRINRERKLIALGWLHALKGKYSLITTLELLKNLKTVQINSYNFFALVWLHALKW